MTSNMADSDSPHESAWNFRSRPIVSCLNCRRKKQKCDRQLPCNACLRSGKPSSCQYAPGQEPAVGDEGGEEHQRQKRQRTENDHGHQRQSDSPVTPARFDELVQRVGQLERALDAQRQQLQALTSRSTSTVHEAPALTEDIPSSSVENKQRHSGGLALYKPLRSLVRPAGLVSRIPF